jgi:SAM-dependent MidA family methyltransferase
MTFRTTSSSLRSAATQLPSPGEVEMVHSQRLVEAIRGEIGSAGGAIPFDRYMELALYAPGLGYYAAGARKFGAAGDFITSPEVSPVFARCLARQCRQVFSVLGGGDLLEFGAGSGVLAADLLLELESLDVLPDRYLILEVSPDLRQRQRETLERQAPELCDRVEWLESMPPSGFRGMVIANELLDAMPVQRCRWWHGESQEQFVTWEKEGFSSVWRAVETPGLEAAMKGIPVESEDYESEINLRAGSWMHSLSQVVEAGAVLLVDYGYSRSEYYLPQRNRGTLMCHYRHRAHADPFVYPGLQDITAHVDFTAVAEAAQAAGLAVAGYTTQAYFLMGSGLDEIVAASDPEDLVAHMNLVQGVKTLTLPSEMGERFKVLGLTRGVDLPLIGFSMRDMRERL